jgi:hypothetical protein
VTGIVVSRDLREENAVDPTTGLMVEKYGTIRLTRDSKVLDMGFFQQNGAWRCATAHEDGTCCIWGLSTSSSQSSMSPSSDADDDSSISMDSTPAGNQTTTLLKRNGSRRLSLVNVSPLMVLKVATTPVLTVGFVTATMLVTGSARNCEICVWSLDQQPKTDPSAATATPVQKLTITRTNPALRSFRSTFVRRIVDGMCTLALFESRSLDAILIQFTETGVKRSPGLMSGAVPFKVNYPVLSVTGDYDVDRDKLVCHVVDVDSIEDLDCPADVAFGAVASVEVRNSIRRASKKLDSMVSDHDDIPMEWNEKQGCCVIS